LIRISIATVALAAVWAPATLAAEETMSLRQAAAPFFPVGVGVDVEVSQRPDDLALLTKHFGYVTPEDCMKVATVQAVEGEFQFDAADRFVRMANEHDLNIVGHCLVWADDSKTPEWFFQDGDDVASAELVLARMKTHIETVMGRYRGQIAMWDVVNEVLADGEIDYLRDSGWTRATGEEFVVKAFEYARAADPDAMLIYNDYRCDTEGKRPKLIRLVEMFQSRGAPVDAIGLQGHYELDAVPLEGIETLLQAMRERGMKVVVSELDIDVVTRSRWWADDGKYREELAEYDPYSDGCPPKVLARQAEQYAQLFRLFAEYDDVIERITFWNLHDGQSWLNYFPWERVNYPLLFDRQRQPKPAFDAVVQTLMEAAAAPSQ
jgi:endo-1,4-beta-xylanase